MLDPGESLQNNCYAASHSKMELANSSALESPNLLKNKADWMVWVFSLFCHGVTKFFAKQLTHPPRLLPHNLFLS